jgi:hypothetical protein
MTVEEFRKSVANQTPPPRLGFALAGLWWDAKGDWTKAHESAQQDEGPAGSWVHAYLHRKAGDVANAEYWYGRASKAPAQSAFEQEWREIAESLLGESGRGTG